MLAGAANVESAFGVLIALLSGRGLKLAPTDAFIGRGVKLGAWRVTCDAT